MSTCTIPAFLDEVYAGLSARGAWTKVTISTGAAGPDVSGDVLEIGLEPIPFTDEPMELGPAPHRQEEYDVSCNLLVIKPNAKESDKKSARDRLAALYGDLETYLNADITLDSTVLDAQLSNGTFEQGYYAGEVNGVYAELKFEIHVIATKQP